MSDDAAGRAGADEEVIQLDTRVQANPESVSCDLAGEAVILDTQNGIYFGLNAVGAHVWNLIREPRTIREIRDRITEEYDVESSRAEEDVKRLVRRMAERRLVRLSQ